MRKIFLLMTLIFSANLFSATPRVYTVNTNLTISVIDPTTDTVVQTIIDTAPSLGSLPTIYAHPNGSKVYVLHSASPTGYITIVNTFTNSIETVLTTPAAPLFLAFSPDGSMAYIPCESVTNNTVVIDTASSTILATITDTSGGTFPYFPAVSPDGQKLFVTNDGSGSGGTRSVSTFNAKPPFNFIASTPTTAGDVYGVGVTPDGSKMYVATNSTTLYEVDTTTYVATPLTSPLGALRFPVVTPDGQRVFVSANSNSFVIYNRNSQTFSTVAAGANNYFATLSPDGSLFLPASLGNGLIHVCPTNSDTPTVTICTGSLSLRHGSALIDNSKVYYACSNSTINGLVSYTVATNTFQNISLGTTALWTTVAYLGNTPSPNTVNGFRSYNNFGTVYERFNTINWSLVSPTPVNYAIYTDSALTQLIGSVGPSVTSFVVHDAPSQQTYYVVAQYTTGQYIVVGSVRL